MEAILEPLQLSNVILAIHYQNVTKIPPLRQERIALISKYHVSIYLILFHIYIASDFIINYKDMSFSKGGVVLQAYPTSLNDTICVNISLLVYYPFQAQRALIDSPYHIYITFPLSTQLFYIQLSYSIHLYNLTLYWS